VLLSSDVFYISLTYDIFGPIKENITVSSFFDMRKELNPFSSIRLLSLSNQKIDLSYYP
jgi:hypothetical protein